MLGWKRMKSAILHSPFREVRKTVLQDSEKGERVARYGGGLLMLI